MNTDSYAYQTTPPEPPRKRRFRAGRVVRRVFWFAVALIVAFGLVRFGPGLYYRFFGAGNAEWLSVRFSETLREKNELVVLEKTITGQETVTQKALLLGNVQEVVVPYDYSLSFIIDLSLARVTAEDGAIVVRLPDPVASYGKLNVDKNQVKKYDWLLPVTTERYAEILSEIETRLYDECASDAANRDAAWQNAVANVEGLFASVAGTDATGAARMIRVLRDDALTPPEATGAADAV